MELTTDDYEEILEYYEEDGEEMPKPTTKNSSVTICEIGRIGFLKYDGTFKLKQVFNNVDIYDIDGSEFYIIKDKKAISISHPIGFDNVKEFIPYILDMGNVEEEKIDKRIYETKTDWYVTQ